MPVNSTEKNRISDVVKFEENHRYSRDVVTVASNQTFALGEVFGFNATGQAVAYDDTAPDGDVATGVMLEDVTTTAATKKAVALRRHAEVVRSGLKFKGTVTTPQQNNAIADLAALGILVRDEAVSPTVDTNN